MQQPNQRGNQRVQQQQPFNPLAIRTKKNQLDKNNYAKMALVQVWKKEWWRALIPLVLFSLPAAFAFSWWWVAGAVIVTVLYILVRSAQVMGVTQMEQSNVLFERVMFEIDQRQILMKRNDREGMALQWDMIERVTQTKDAYQMYLKGPAADQLPKGWKGWLAKNFNVPVFLHLPFRIFNSPNDLKLMESLLRRKNFIPA
ncbi:YcxB family protein [Rufibacter sp. XAAS-G3-1]|uniref:YcxB family protein n=1 Tax=Rufibacter sp. XAAS-G3-1 TaxID=2729134 RepID=UPI0015E79C96|nr:YcxB family protein [Rufibacter sp. XAAS-G3-1]